MESISITELSDSQWQQYFEMTQELCKKYYPEFYDTSRTGAELKNELLKYHSESSNIGHKRQVIFEDGNPIGYFWHTNHREVLGWGFDFCLDKIHDTEMRFVLTGIYKALKPLDEKYTAYDWEYDKRKIDAMKSAGAEVRDRMLTSRLYRKEMKTELFREFTVKYQPGSEFSVSYLNKFPEALIVKLAPFLNELFEDMNSRNPNPHEFTPQTEEDIRRYIKINTDEISVNHILLIKDKDEEIAGMCSVFEDRNKVPRLRHMGGFTGVASKYRGNGFAKFMKAFIYDKLVSENVPFEYASTDTAPWNTYMYKINEELGFKPYKEGFEFKFTKEKLKQYLEKSY